MMQTLIESVILLSIIAIMGVLWLRSYTVGIRTEPCASASIIGLGVAAAWAGIEVLTGAHHHPSTAIGWASVALYMLCLAWAQHGRELMRWAAPEDAQESRP